MTSLGAPDEWSKGEHLLGFLRLDAVAEGEMQHLPIIPLEIPNPHGIPNAA